MDRATIIKSLHQFVAEKLLEGNAEDLTPTTPLLELRILDSFSLVELLAFVEAELHAEIAIELLLPEHLADIESLATLVEQHLPR